MSVVERLRYQPLTVAIGAEAAAEIQKLRQHRDALLTDLAASLDREDALIKQRDELAADAKRYRYIKAEIECSTGWLAVSNWDTVQWENFKAGADLDSAIDAAIAKVGADKTGEES